MSIPEVNKGNFNTEVLASQVPVLVFVTADWCGPCHVMESILVELGTEFDGDIKIVQVDVTKYDDIAARWEVKALPTVIFFREGEEIERFWGPKSKDGVVEMIKRED